MVSPHFPASSWIALRGIALLFESLQNRSAFLLFIQKPRQFFAQDSSIVNLHNWSQGSFSGMTWGNVRTAALVVLPALAAAFCLAKPMAAYQMGEAYARSVGVDVRRFSRLLVLLSSLLAACVTAFAGPISFVGIAVPHLVKQLLGSARPLYVLPGCCLGGAAFCALLCEFLIVYV